MILQSQILQAVKRLRRSVSVRFGLSIPVRVGRRHIEIPPVSKGGLWVWQSWTPNWKSRLIGAVLSQRPGAFVDVGANLGRTLADYLSLEEQTGYVGFEANPTCVVFLQRLIEANNLTDCRIVGTALGEGSSVASLQFRPGGYEDPSGSLLPGLRPGRELTSMLVSVLSFDDAWTSLGDVPISLVKIDVEGAELEVIRGMSSLFRGNRPWIICEVLRRDFSADPQTYEARIRSLNSLLNAAGYSIYEIFKKSESIDLVGCSEFPLDVWTTEVADRCDYLFVHTSENLEDFISGTSAVNSAN